MYNLFRCEAHSEAIETGFRLMHDNAFAARPELQARLNGALNMLERINSKSRQPVTEPPLPPR